MAKEKKIPMPEVMWADCNHVDADKGCIIPFLLNKDNTEFMETNASNHIVRLSERPLETEEAYNLIKAYYEQKTGAVNVNIIDTITAVASYYPLNIIKALMLNGYEKLSRKAIGYEDAFGKKTQDEINKLTYKLNKVKRENEPPFTDDETARIYAQQYIHSNNTTGKDVADNNKSMGDN